MTALIPRAEPGRVPVFFSPLHALARALALLAPFSPAWAQTAPLNDTGQTQCYNAADAADACTQAVTGNTGVRPGQDARFGRDAAQAAGALPAKAGGGVAGFDFTALDASGNATAPGSHACVRDNVTGLTWSTETLGTMNWAAANTTASGYSRCGHASGWRLPTRRELLSIVHNGAASAPRIDTTYFPGTQPTIVGYWTADTYAPPSTSRWTVRFNHGSAAYLLMTLNDYVRFVHSGP